MARGNLVRTRTPKVGVPAVVTLFVLIVAACGGGGNGDDASTEGSDPGSPSVTLAAEGPPRSGGRLIYAVGSESDGWDPTRNRWANDGTIIGMAIYDPLAAFDENGDWAPYLAESIEPDDDFTEWTITLRPGITFHNGDPLDATAVQRTFEGHLESALTAPAFSRVDRVEVTDALTAVVHLNAPWAAMPVGLTGQAGMIAAPSQLESPDTSSLRPVGTGPFRFVEWLPDNRLVVERNEEYWRTDEDGTRLPYLEGIEFRPIPDDDARVAAMRSGDIDMAYTSTTSAGQRFRALAAEGSLQLVEQEGQTEVAFIMLNHERPPFDDPAARLALAHATNRDQWVEVVGQGVIDPATTLFRPGSRWHADVPFPEHDLDEARRQVEAYESVHGPLAFDLSALSTPLAKSQAELLKEMWEQAGMRVDINQTDGSSYILDSVLGDYQAVVWGQFASPDPDYEHVWWDGANARPLGELSLNFPRHQDAAVDAALDDARSTSDFDSRYEAYREVQEHFAENLPYVWLSYVRPLIVAQNDVRGITNGPLPDGTPSRPIGGPGSFSLATRVVQVWLTE
jgi:peptide/nickel transport system substrate-binding protein